MVMICAVCNSINSYEQKTNYIVAQKVLRIDNETQKPVLADEFRTKKERFYQCSVCEELMDEERFLETFGAKQS